MFFSTLIISPFLPHSLCFSSMNIIDKQWNIYKVQYKTIVLPTLIFQVKSLLIYQCHQLILWISFNMHWSDFITKTEFSKSAKATIIEAILERTHLESSYLESTHIHLTWHIAPMKIFHLLNSFMFGKLVSLRRGTGKDFHLLWDWLLLLDSRSCWQEGEIKSTLLLTNLSFFGVNDKTKTEETMLIVSHKANIPILPLLNGPYWLLKELQQMKKPSKILIHKVNPWNIILLHLLSCQLIFF